jgi:hypothetical protein
MTEKFKKSKSLKRTAELSEESGSKKKFKDEGGKSKTTFKRKFVPGKKFDNSKSDKPLEKPNWNDLKSKKKDLKIQRKKNRVKDLYEISVQAKKLYEQLKQ